MLDKLFKPKSIAVIGASNKPYKIGKTVLDNLTISYHGKIYPINLNEKEINGLKCYKSILNVPGRVDIAVIVVPSKNAPLTVEECGNKGVK